MGAWGYEAYENDTAGNWLFKHFVPRLRRTIASKRADTHEQLAALAIACDLGLSPWLDLGEVDAAVARIDKDDLEAGWDDLAARRRYVKLLQRRIYKDRVLPTRSWSPLFTVTSETPPATKPRPTKPRRTTKVKP
jgi:hypothetical protein